MAGKQRKIIDAHAHIFPGKIAQRACVSIRDFYDLEMDYEDGYPHTLIESGKKAGVSRYLVCSTATKANQVESINDFIAAKCKKYPEFFGFGALHPQMEQFDEEIERIAELGLHGIKLHPDFQQFDIDAPHMLPVYRKIAKMGLPILFHTGDRRYEYSAPAKLANVAKAVSDLICIAAHFGGYERWAEANACLKLDNVYFDTSSSLFKMNYAEALEMIDHMGVDHFMFGTDFPMWNHEEELERFYQLHLSETENDQILYQNFERLFQL